MEPQKFGRYEIKAEIGRGGMATVYHAYDPRFEREVALKVLPREMLHDPQFRTRFEREAKTIAMLEHPAIVPVYDFGEEDGQPYFVMRYMNGGSLSDRMKKGPMTIQDVAHLFGRLAPALDEAHAKGIIHRDLKPGNILFDQHDEPYISDFGIAKITASQANVTGSAILGTPAYMSPEQAQGEGIDGRSDIYGLAVILFELLTGTQPYHGDTPMSVVVKHITDPIPHILDVNPDLPASIEAVIEKAMAKDREERFPTVKALTDALNAVARGEPPDLGIINKTLIASSRTDTTKRPATEPRAVLAERGQKEEPGPPTLSKKKSGLWIGLGGVALLVCVAVVAGVVLFKDRIPFLAAPTPTHPPIVRSTDTPEAPQPTNTDIPDVVLPPVASDTPTPSITSTLAPSPTPTLPSLPSLGGADLIAFLNNKDIWVMGVDGSNPVQITKDGGAKTDLQWSPDGQSVFYINGTCVYSVSVPERIVAEITCYPGAKFLEAFEISPDGLRVAISVDRDLYVVPFDLTTIYKARNGAQLAAMKGCLPITGLDHDPFKSVQWSNDGTRLAVKIISSEPDVYEAIRILDISTCESYMPHVLDNFPALRFTMTDYSRFREIPSFDWDGDAVFVLNSKHRYGMGYLFKYYSLLYKGEELKPLEDCCYAAAHFSPDGSYLLFAYQVRLSPNDQPQLYYIPFGSIGTETSYTPLPLPDGAFNPPGDPLGVALRPVKP